MNSAGSLLSAATLADLELVENVFAELLPIEGDPGAPLAGLQSRKLDAILSWVSRHVPYYSDLSPLTGRSLSDLPIVDKALLMSGLPSTCAEPGLDLEQLRRHIQRDERDSDFALFRDRYYLRRTSGTTGYLGFFLWDESMGDVAERSATRFLSPPHQLPKPVVAVAPVVVWHPLFAAVYGLHSLPISTGLAGTIDRLHDLQPGTVMGSPGFLTELAEEQIAGRLRIAPEVVVVGSEWCTQLQRARMRCAWSIDPSEQYGLSEAGLIASRCSLGNYHVHADTVILELLDKQGRPCQPGEVAHRALLTRLFGPIQPILRYELGDRLVAGPQHCPCGSPFHTLARIEGRRQARLWLRRQGGGAIGLSPYTLIPTLETTPGMARYQIRYEHPDDLQIALLSELTIDHGALVDELRQQLRQREAVPPRITIRPGDVPSVWAAPPGSKDHHLRLTVTREQISALSDG